MNARWSAVLAPALSLLCVSAVSQVEAGSFFLPSQSIRLEGKLNCPRILEHGGTAYLQLSVLTPDLEAPARRPMNVAVVLDRSGSMGYEMKIENARAAVRTLVDHLRPDDILSIVIYDDVVEVLRPAGRVGNKDRVRRQIDEVYPRGWTNLGGGLVEGIRQAERYSRRGYANRVILLSDGLANRGITDPDRLSRIARKARSSGISVTSVGVGLEYNENLMLALAEGGGGNYYFVEDAGNLASLFRKEFQGMSNLVAQNARLELRPAHGVRVIDVVGCEYSREGDNYSVTVGDLYASERRDITVVLDVPAGKGRRRLASAVLKYDSEGGRELASNSVSVGVRYTRDVADVDRHRDMEVQAQAEVAVSTRRVEEALQALDRGDKDEAVERLEDVRRDLAASPAASAGGEASAILREQETKLKAYSDTLMQKDGNEVRAKKSIQYENYRVQKKK